MKLNDDLLQLATIHKYLNSQQKTPAFFLLRKTAESVDVGSVESYIEFFANVPLEEV